MKYIIMCDSVNKQPFKIPRQLTEIKGEKLVCRTIRLLKENGIKDIIITSHDERFDNLGAIRYEPQFNEFDGKTGKGYWLNAFTKELLIEPVTFLFGDVYYSEKAIKTIVETETKYNLFFCTYNNTTNKYIKHHDEPLAYKVLDCKLFLEHIDIVKKLYDEGKTVRHPIVWELYRSMNGLNVNKHVLTNNYIAINDESCDIDTINDIMALERKLGGIKMVKCRAISDFTLREFDKLVNIKRAKIDEKGKLFVNDEFECDEVMAKYLEGENPKHKRVIEVIEVIPVKEEVKTTIEYHEEEKPKATVKKTTKKRTNKKK